MASQPGVNRQRGEVGLILEGRCLALVPSFALIAEIEDGLGPLPGLLARLAKEREWPAREVAEVLRLAVAHAPGAPAPERVEPLLLAAGLAGLRLVALELLVNALAGAEPAAGEAEGLPPGKPPAAWIGAG